MTNAYKLGSQSSPYGWRIHPQTGEKEFHAGQDFKAPAGTPIPAATSGEVVYSGLNKGFGNVVIVKNSAGGYSLYAHMQDGDRVQLGQRIWPGDILGRVGSTGNSTGPHLHYSVIGNEAGEIIENSDRPRDGGSIGIKLNEENTIDPAGYDPTPPYLGKQDVPHKSCLAPMQARLPGTPLPIVRICLVIVSENGALLPQATRR
jgi:murein DD-endopeptidase MepM/ murein hydrolase activator NlpD